MNIESLNLESLNIQSMWEIEEALLLIQAVQQHMYPHGYCIALGGGVLNNGFSHHDLDLCMIPRTDATSFDALGACAAFEREGTRFEDADYHWMFQDREQQGDTTLVRFRDFASDKIVELRFVTETNIWR